MQSDKIKDIFGTYDEAKAFFYIILNGEFKVSSLRFNKSKRKKLKKYKTAIKGKQISETVYETEIKKQRKVLVSGEYFGEVSFIYNCQRSSTIKAKLYSTLGCIDYTIMNELMFEYPEFTRHLRNEIVQNYDDDLKLFLVKAL